MTYIICGTIVHEEYETKIPQLSNAANRFLLNFTKEIKKIHAVKVLSYMGIDVPSNVKETLKIVKASGTGINYYFKSRLKIAGIVVYWHAISQNLKNAECIIAYNPVYAYLNAPYMARLYRKKSVLILADYSPKESCFGRLRQIYAALQLKSIRRYDMVIGLTENIKRYLNDNQKFIHLYGGIDRFAYDYFDQKNSLLKYDKIIFMYAGTLEKVTGIDLLLEAFVRIESDIAELWISGKGSMADMVEKYIAKDARIRYLGCPVYRDYLDNLKKVNVLVNPRNMNLLENENNFPSKVLEYLATGKEIISTKFQGWNDFSEYIIFCESTVSSIEEKIRKICAENYREDFLKYNKKREFAREFIWDRQMEKVLEKIQTI